MTTTPTRPTTRADHVSTYHGLAADDGLPLNLLQVRGRREPTRGPVMLVHGSGVRAEIFRPPVERSFVDVLLDDGWDVWLLNWRASIDFDPVPWTLDDAAAYDHPAAVRYVLEATGAAEHEGRGALPGVDVAVHVGGGRTPARARHDRQQRGVPASGDPAVLAVQDLAR